jgi:KUP system potassium uptake protein
MRRIWGWNKVVAALIVLPLFLIDLSFLASNSLKVPAGGWFPLLIGAVVFTLLTTWKRGRALLMERPRRGFDAARPVHREHRGEPADARPGTAAFLTSTVDRVPHALLHNLKHNKVLHDRVVFLTIHTQDFPRVSAAERVRIAELGCAFWRMDAYYGFAEGPRRAGALEAIGKDGFEFDMMETSFFVSRRR